MSSKDGGHLSKELLRVWMMGGNAPFEVEGGSLTLHRRWFREQKQYLCFDHYKPLGLGNMKHLHWPDCHLDHCFPLVCEEMKLEGVDLRE